MLPTGNLSFIIPKLVEEKRAPGSKNSLKRRFPKIMESFTITEKAHNWAFSWLTAPTGTVQHSVLIIVS